MPAEPVPGRISTPDTLGGVELYESADGSVELQVRTDGETVWLTRQQLAALFGRDVKTIGKHVANARREELVGLPVVAKFATTAADGKTYQVEHYALDMVLAVGYRVKSAEGIRFRQWATQVLKTYMVRGAALNERRLAQIGQVVRVLSRTNDPKLAGAADVLAGYVPGLQLLRDYDEGRFPESVGAAPNWELTLDEARETIQRLRAQFPADTLLGNERSDALAGIVVKDHPLSDGNKRTAAALFITFLSRNGILNSEDGRPVVTNNALAATTLLVASSDPKEKELMVALIARMISGSTR
jgi:hypothetical protein